MRESYQSRGAAIARCVAQTAAHVEALRGRREADQAGGDNFDLLKELRREQSKVGNCSGNTNSPR